MIESSQLSKITGMLIDLDILDLAEIIDMLESEDSLRERVKEAEEVINDSEL